MSVLNSLLLKRVSFSNVVQEFSPPPTEKNEFNLLSQVASEELEGLNNAPLSGQKRTHLSDDIFSGPSSGRTDKTKRPAKNSRTEGIIPVSSLLSSEQAPEKETSLPNETVPAIMAPLMKENDRIVANAGRYKPKNKDEEKELSMLLNANKGLVSRVLELVRENDALKTQSTAPLPHSNHADSHGTGPLPSQSSGGIQEDSEKTALRNEVERLRKELEETKKSNRYAEQTMASLSGDNIRFQKALVELNSTIQALGKELDESRKKLEEQEHSASIAKKYEQEISTLKAANNWLKDRSEHLQTELQKLTQSTLNMSQLYKLECDKGMRLSATLANETETKNKYAAMLTTLLEKANQLEQEASSLRRTLSEKEQDLQSLRKQVAPPLYPSFPSHNPGSSQLPFSLSFPLPSYSQDHTTPPRTTLPQAPNYQSSYPSPSFSFGSPTPPTPPGSANRFSPLFRKDGGNA